jgi:hypothetical protein
VLICQLKGLSSFEPSYQFGVVEQLDRFDVVVMMKPPFTLGLIYAIFNKNRVAVVLCWFDRRNADCYY